MTIKDKLDLVLKNHKYTFCDIDFNIYDNDYVFIYDKIDGNIIYSCSVSDIDNIPIELSNKEPAKEILVKSMDYSTRGHKPYIISFYLGKPKEIIEKPIFTGMKYRN